MAKTKNIKLVDLLVNTENYRFEPVTGQKEAIDKLVDDQTDKLYNLAEHMVQNGLNPNDRIQVAPSSHDPSKYNVMEGNRRTVAMKLLSNPDLIDNHKHSNLKRKFKKLHEGNSRNLIKSVECTVYDSPADADKWIKLKHAGQSEGVGTVPWLAQQVQRFEEKVEGKSSIALQTIKLLQQSNEVPSNVKSNLAELKVTNLDRLLSDPDVRDLLGIEINGGIIQSDLEEKEVVKGLTRVATDLLNPKFNVKKIYTKQDRKEYIKKFPKASTPNSTAKAKKPWQFNTSSATGATGPAKKTRATPKDRKTLIPKSCVIKITKPKVNNIYHELLKLDVNNYTNACAVLFRVFFELSVDTYMEENGLSSLSAAKSGMDFQQKVFQVANHLEQKKLADAAICKGIKVSAKDSNGILGIDTWHAYVHNNRFSPSSNSLRLTWDGIQDFMVILWNNIK
jgi:hypothetical protein